MHRLTGPALAGAAWCISAFVPSQLLARDDGRFANSPLKAWFDRLASAKGLCCSFADGVSVQNVDWDTKDGRYRVRLNGQWLVVEPGGAVALAALMTGKIDVTRKVAVAVLSGGNVDPDVFSRLVA